MENTALAEGAKLTSSILLIALVIVLGFALILYRKELRALLGGVKQLKYKDFTAEFDKLVGDAFATASERVWKRTEDTPEYLTDPDFYFSDGDFASAKQLQSMMPPWRWLPKSKPHARRNIRTLCQDLADQYRKVRTKRASAVVARMRMLAFAAYPMIPELMATDRTGERIAAIAFLQARPCYDVPVLRWLGERISPKEELLVQYHAVGALLAACRNAEATDIKLLREIVEAAIEICNKTPEKDRGERALELLVWCQFSLGGKPFARILSETATHTAERPESKPA
jgi:hypothetical protein